MLAALAVLAAQPAGAGTFSVNAGSLSFPAYDEAAAGGTHATAPVTLTCARECPGQVTVRLGEGMHDAGPGQRRLANAARPGSLWYQLSLETDGGASGESLRAAVREGAPLRFRVSGEIPAGQDATVGSYHDRVTVFIDW